MVFLICYPTASFPEDGEPELPLHVIHHLLAGWTPSTTKPVFSKRARHRVTEAKAELQAIEAVYAAESGKRRCLPDTCPHSRVRLVAIVGPLAPTCQDVNEGNFNRRNINQLLEAVPRRVDVR